MRLFNSRYTYAFHHFQHKTAAHEGVQIDYLIQTQFNTIYVIEIKFTRDLIRIEVVADVEEKIKRLHLPKGYSVRPVLIHVNGISPALEERQFFSHIIDFGELFDSPQPQA